MNDTMTFGGVCVSDLFEVIDVDKSAAGRTNQTQTVSGRDGVIVTGTAMDPLPIVVTFLIDVDDDYERRERVRELTMLLQSKEPRELEFGSDFGLRYMAMMSGTVAKAEHVRADAYKATLVAQDPIMYGDEVEVEVPASGSVLVNVGGTYPTYPVITGYGAGVESEGYLWGIRMDDGPYINVPMGDATSKAFSIDCAKREVMVSNAITLATMDSDWLELTTGEHELEVNVGTGGCVVSFVERWM